MKNYVISSILSFILSLLFCFLLIPLLKKLKAGQNILSYVKEHKSKSGTPTMGGLAFILSAILSTIIIVKKMDRVLIVTIITGVSYMLVGFLDDMLKMKHKKNLGLKAWQKAMFQFFAAIFVGLFCLRFGLTKINIPFSNKIVDIKNWIFPFSIFIFLATVNSVNLLDGLDGLAAGVSSVYLIFMGIIIILTYGNKSLTILSFSLVGSLLAFLLFNANPASIFMGDTGSLGLGGFISCISLFTGNSLFLPLIGIMYVVSSITVIMQVIYFKATKGKRIFLMAPIHHHFQQKGYSEVKISYAYSIITGIIGLICVFYYI